jgi:hypothetical protein
VGDSLTADNALLSPAWPALLERLLNASGVRVEVHNIAINGWTYYRANTEDSFGTNTMREELIALAPDIVICALGRNDADTLPGVRPLATLIADATTFYDAVRAALPDATIVNAAPSLYDTVHATAPGTTLLNRQVMPVYFQLRGGGDLLASAYCSEIMADSVSADTKTRTTNMIAINAAVAALASVDAVYTFPAWRAARMGCIGYDTLHPTAEASIFFAAAARNAFYSSPVLAAALPGLSDQNYAPFNSVDFLFDGLLQSSSGQYVPVTPVRDINHTVAQHGPWRAALPVSWFLPSKGGLSVASTTYTIGTAFTWSLEGCPPSAAVSLSVDGAAFAAISGAATDGRGNYNSAVPLTVTEGAHALRVKVGNEIYGPVTFTAAAAPAPSGVTQAVFDSAVGALSIALQSKVSARDLFEYGPAVLSGANLASPGTQSGAANTRNYINFDAANVRISHPNLLTITKVGNETRLGIVTPPGKRVFWRLAISQLITGSVGADTAHIYGAEQMNAGGGTDFNSQIVMSYSPVNGYATLCNGVLPGVADAPIFLIPWVFPLSVITLSSTAANGFSSFYSLEIISIVDLP